MGVVLNAPLILASASPRRAELMRLLEVEFRVLPSGADESFLRRESPEAHVRRLSGLKAEAVAAGHPECWVLGADTVVAVGREVLGKPATPREAGRMLKKLSGREHAVYTGFTFRGIDSGISIQEVVASKVAFRKVPDDEIAWYVNSREPYDKAGGYAVQGMAALFIREIQGSYTNVMGLPLCEVLDAMKKAGAVRFVS
ncbi:MAG: Septum formation protein Maf [Syntrophaceae bacterium PtaB.Bin095]|jgi:septum formation protein|nr:MAG: Septum formation protein Maf [Syntrophaceae bacterium PtaB.Bin095]